MISRLKHWVKIAKHDTVAIYLAVRDPRTPWFAKALAAFIIAYALSPIDLIPDFIPVIGYLDDLILVPIGLSVAVRLIPTDVMDDCRVRAKQIAELPANKKAVSIIATIWVAAAILTGWLIYAASTALPPD